MMSTTRHSSTRRCPLVRSGATILWLDDPHRLVCDERIQKLDQLRRVVDNCIIHCKTLAKCPKYLKQAPSYECVIIVAILCDHDDNRKQSFINPTTLKPLYEYEQVKSIFIVLPSMAKASTEETENGFLTHWLNDSSKAIDIFNNYDSMLEILQQFLTDREEHDDDLFATVERKQKCLVDVREELGIFVWTHSYRVILQAMPHESSEAKREMLAECRAQYRGNHHVLMKIDEFQRTYRPEDAIIWYSKNSFLYRIINKALRTEDIFALYTFRYYITDLCARLEELASVTNDRRQGKRRVYRGSKLHRDELKKLHVGTLVATNGFLSTSASLDVAEAFVSIGANIQSSVSSSQESGRQRVIFEIDVDQSQASDVIMADISGQSVIPDEKEILFSLGATFAITDMCHDMNNNIWRIQMVSSSEMTEVSHEYDRYIRSRLTGMKPAMLFGHLLGEVTSDYARAMSYFHRLLRAKTTTMEDHPNIYYQLARVYRYIGKYTEAITYFRQAQLLFKHQLPQSTLDYGRTLAGLGTTYCELGDTKRAIRLYERVMEVYQGHLPYKHVERGFHLNRLAYAMWQEQRYEEALALLTRSLSFFNEDMPPNHPGHSEALHNMGLVQHALGHRDQSIDYLKQALRMRELSLADDHPFIARTCYQLSFILAEQDHEHRTALEYAQRAFSIRKKKLPRSHFEVQQSTDLVRRLSAESTETRVEENTV